MYSCGARDDAPPPNARAPAGRSADRTYRITISPNKLRNGATYTVRLSVRSADGKRRQSARLSAKRL